MGQHSVKEMRKVSSEGAQVTKKFQNQQHIIYGISSTISNTGQLSSFAPSRPILPTALMNSKLIPSEAKRVSNIVQIEPKSWAPVNEKTRTAQKMNHSSSDSALSGYGGLSFSPP